MRPSQIGHRRRIGAARIDDDPANRRIGRLGRFESTEQHRVRVGHVAAGEQHGAGRFEIVVAGGRPVCAERHLVGAHGARHAQSRVRVDVVGAHQPLGELVEDVVVLGQQLS